MSEKSQKRPRLTPSITRSQTIQPGHLEEELAKAKATILRMNLEANSLKAELRNSEAKYANLKLRYWPYIVGFDKFVEERKYHNGKAILVTTTVFPQLTNGECERFPATSSNILYSNTLAIDNTRKTDQLKHIGFLGEWLHSLYCQNRKPQVLQSSSDSMTSMKDYNRAMFDRTSDELFRLILGIVDGNSELLNMMEFVQLEFLHFLCDLCTLFGAS